MCPHTTLCVLIPVCVRDDDMHPEGNVARLQAELNYAIALTKLVMQRRLANIYACVQDDDMHPEGRAR
jgi:hypothetical protein